MVNQKSTVRHSTTGSLAPANRWEGRLNYHFNFTKSILFILIAFSTLLLLSSSAMAVGYVAGTPATSAGGATPIYTIEDLSNIRNNLNGNYILMTDLDFSTGMSPAYENTLGWKVGIEIISIVSDDVTFKLTNNGSPMANADIQYFFGGATATETDAISTDSNGEFTIDAADSGFVEGTAMVLFIGGTDATVTPVTDKDFALFYEVTDSATAVKETYHLGNFKPIGSSTTPFTGTFNGNHHTITGIETALFYGGAVIEQVHSGMFAYISGATVKNVVTVDGSATVVAYLDEIAVNVLYPPGSPERMEWVYSQGTGMIVGKAFANSIVDNCSNSGTSIALYFVGGIVGYNSEASTVSNCTNFGKMTSYVSNAGGVVGYNYANSTVTNCMNSGTVISYGSGAGGVVGQNFNNSMTSNSTNSGTVMATLHSAGGIVSTMTNSTVTNSTNSGTITANFTQSGGIVSAMTNSTVTDSTNTGAVTTGADLAGGIVGNNIRNSIVANSINSGTVTAANSAGGIVGLNNQASTVTNSTNSGDVTTVATRAGGIVGLNNLSTVTNSINSGNVTATNNCGGIVGSNRLNSIVSTSSNSGNVTATVVTAGGIVGWNVNSMISDSLNSGDVTAIGNNAGGIAGANNGSISMSVNTGDIQAAEYAGGIAGRFGSNNGDVLADLSIINCYNTGAVTATSSNAGGIVGGMQKSTFDVKVDSTYNSNENVNAPANFGGIAGEMGPGVTASANVLKSYHIVPSSGAGTTAGEVKTAEQLKIKETYIDWDFTDIWGIDITEVVNGGYPFFESFVNVVIKTQPTHQTIFDGDRATFFVEMLKSAPYNYQWEISTDGGSTWTNAPGISVISAYVTDPLSYGSTDQFRCVVTSLVAPSASATSTIGTVDVRYQSLGSNGGSKGPGATISNNTTQTPPVYTPINDGNSNTVDSTPNGPSLNGLDTTATGSNTNNTDNSGFFGGIKTWFGNHPILGYGGIIALAIVITGVAVYFVKFRGKDY